MDVLFPSEPFDAKAVDSAFAAELEAARRAGFRTWLVDAAALDEGNFARAVRTVPEGNAIFRGWMMRTGDYAALYDALVARGCRLINDAKQYEHAHHLPASYPILEGVTPETVWTETPVDFPSLMKLLARFGERPLIVKDFVKSQKHDWAEACFIPSAADARAVERVVSRFLELTGEALTGGLVFREFVELAPLGRHSKSGMPLTQEFRRFVLDGETLATVEYWEEGEYQGETPPPDLFGEIAARVESRF